MSAAASAYSASTASKRHVTMGRAAPPRPVTPDDIRLFLPHVTREQQAPYFLYVVGEPQEKYVPAGEGKHARRPAPRPSLRAPLEDDEIELVLVEDEAGRALELRLEHAPVPAQLLQALALCVPHHPALARLSARYCALQRCGLLQLACLLDLSNITDVCLDGSPDPHRDYRPLLERGRLRRLSLARCELGDEGARRCGAQLAHPWPAALALRSLALGSNGIGDDGARALAAALRSNSALLHLDLSGNRIGDDGAVDVLGSLRPFPLERDELLATRRRLVDYSRRLRLAVERIEAQRTAAAAAPPSEPEMRRRRPHRGARAAPSAPPQPTERLAEAELGPFDDPFRRENTESRDGRVYSRGNSTLRVLNLAYNSLEWGSLLALLATLRAQAGAAAGGLLHVRLEGNPLPMACAELREVDVLLERAVADATPLKKTEKAHPKTKH